MSSDLIPSSLIDNNSSSSSADGTHSIADVLLYAESKMTRKQAVREIGDIVLRANMKPRTVKHALQLLKNLLPPANTLPSTIDELFGAMLSSENDWRLAQYLIRHKQQPSFSSSPNLWSDSSNSNPSITAASSSSIPHRQELDPSARTSSIFLPVSSSSSSSSSSNTSDSESSSSLSSSSDDDDDDDDASRHLLLALQGAEQQQRPVNPSPLPSITESADMVNNLSSSHLLVNPNVESSEQRSQLIGNSHNRFPFLGSFKRQRSDTSSASEPDLFFTRQISDDDSDDDTLLYSINNNNTNKNNINQTSRCFELNGCDVLDGGKRRRH